MRARILLGLSLGVCLLLAWMLISLSHELSRDLALMRPPMVQQFIPAGEKLVKTNVVVRRQFFHWRQLESEDYTVYIANLRSIGCPEPTIRDIIVSDVDEMFERRRRAEVVTPDQEWWRLEPSPDTLEAAAQKIQDLEKERVELLNRLLGPGWAGMNKPAPEEQAFNRLDGPVLGKLGPEVRAALRKIEGDSRQRTTDLLKTFQEKGESPHGSELAKLRLQTREELAKVLTPEQLEEYLLRYSSHALQMRRDLRGFEAGQEEFRKIFRATDAFEAELATLADATDAFNVKRRKELEAARDEAVKQALGQDRLTLYQFSQDPLFRQAQGQVEQAGMDADKVLPIFQVNRATEEEIQRLKKDSSLTEEARDAALHKVQREQAQAIQKILGTDKEQ